MVDAAPADAAQLPPYLADDNVSRGIMSLLVQDRVKEEIFHLQEEHRVMINWLSGQIQNLKATISNCNGQFLMNFHVTARVKISSMFQDSHMLFFLKKSLKETINTGANWMTHTAPWQELLDNPKWPADVKNSNSKKRANDDSKLGVNESDDDSDESDYDVDSNDAELSLSDLEFEEDEVDSLLNIME